MALEYRVSDGGVVLAEESMDSAAVERALRQRDPDLRLQGWPSERHNMILWKVVRLVPDRPPETICVWQSDRGEPYPLSSALLTMVDRIDKNTRAVYVDEDRLNARKAEREQHSLTQEQDGMVDEYSRREGRHPMLPRSQSLRMARDKQRAKGKKV